MIHSSVQAEDLLAESSWRRLVRHGLHGVHPRVHDVNPVKRFRLCEHRGFGASVFALTVMAQEHVFQQHEALAGNTRFFRDPVQVRNSPHQVPQQLSVTGIVCYVSGLVGCFLSQMLGPYGLMVTTPIWIVPGIISGFASGMIYKAFKRKTTIPVIAVTVFLAELITTIYNWFGSYLGDVVILKDMTLEVLVAAIPIRLVNWALRCVVFTIILVPLCKTLLKSCPAGIRQAKQNAKAAATTSES